MEQKIKLAVINLNLLFLLQNTAVYSFYYIIPNICLYQITNQYSVAHIQYFIINILISHRVTLMLYVTTFN